MFKQSQYFTTNQDGSLNCDICPRRCKFVKPGQRGFCYVRGRRGSKIGLTCYGKMTSLAIDPVEKKPLYHFLPGARVLSMGTIGCNMGCLFCQNWHITKSKNDSLMDTKLTPSEFLKTALKNNCEAVAYTYNDPIIFFEYARDCAKKCRKKGIKNIAVTAGYINPKPREEFFSLMDGANIDLKGFSEVFYKNIVNASLKPVLETIEYVKNKTNCWLEITNLVIPGENDSDKMIKDMCRWIKKYLGTDTPLHFSAFHPCYKMMDRIHTPIKTLIKARDIAISEGLKYVYTGNVNDIKTSATYCSKCKNPVIERGRMSVFVIDMKDGKCNKCGTAVSGVFRRN